MDFYSTQISNLVEQLSHLPGIGAKSAQRLAFHVLSLPEEEAAAFARAIVDAKAHIHCCPVCQNLTEGDGPCPICASAKRDETTVCVVADPKDVVAMERSREYGGVYHVLHGVISPMNHIGPDELRIQQLVERVSAGGIEEVIMATNPDTEGETTAMYLSRLLKPFGVRTTRLAYGIPVGGHLEFADEATLTRALEGRREKFILQSHICAVWQNGQYKRTRDIAQVKSGFESMLELLQTDHLDVGMIHYCDSMADWREIAVGPVLAYALELKRAGVIRHVGLSSHNPQVALEAVSSGHIEVLMFSVNPCYDLLPGDEDLEKLWADDSYAKPLLNLEPQREKLYEACQRLGVGITVMKAFGGGDLLTNDSPAGKALTVCQCLQYALDRPAVAAVMVGAHSVAELADSLHYCEATAAERDYAAAFVQFPRISWQGHCMYCGHCAPCPQGIDIAAVTKFFNLAKAQGEIPETVREHYAALSVTAQSCIGCGACVQRCPFMVDAPSNMQAACDLFGF